MEKVSIGDKSLEDYLDILNIEFNVSLPTKLSASLGLDVGLATDDNPIFVNDDCSISCDFVGNVACALRIWNPLTKQLVDLSPNLDIFNIPIIDAKNIRTLYFSDFSGTTITGASNGYMEVKSKKYRPFFWNIAYPETGFGFCIKKDGADRCTLYDASESYAGYTGIAVFDFRRSIDYTSFDKNVTYRCFPYTEVKLLYGLLGKARVYRRGFSFHINDEGKLSTSSLEDIPGEDL